MGALASTHNSFVQNLSGFRILGVEQVIEKERLAPLTRQDTRGRTACTGLLRTRRKSRYASVPYGLPPGRVVGLETGSRVIASHACVK